MMELDNGLEVSRQELSRLRARAAEEEERWRGREQALMMRLEDGRVRERKLEDQKHNLEVCLADATQQIQELRVSQLKIRKTLKTLLLIYIFIFYLVAKRNKML